MAKKKSRKATRTTRTVTRTARTARASMSGMEKGDVSLPSSNNKKKWLYIGIGILIILAIIYYVALR